MLGYRVCEYGRQCRAHIRALGERLKINAWMGVCCLLFAGTMLFYAYISYDRLALADSH